MELLGNEYYQLEIQGLVDLWVMGIYFAWFIYTKSMLGFMGIYHPQAFTHTT